MRKRIQGSPIIMGMLSSPGLEHSVLAWTQAVSFLGRDTPIHRSHKISLDHQGDQENGKNCEGNGWGGRISDF